MALREWSCHNRDEDGRTGQDKELVLLQVLHPKAVRMLSLRVDGGAFLGLALFSGLIGGCLGAFMQSGMPNVSVAHGILLDLFVILPAFLGGMGRLVVPAGLTEAPKGCRIADRIALLSLLAGALCVLQGLATSGFSGLAIIFWSIGIVLLAMTTIIRVLDCRIVRFRALCAFAWSQLLASLGVIVVVPVLLAGITHDMMAGGNVIDSVAFWLNRIQTPLLSLSVELALGACASLGASSGLVSFRSHRLRSIAPVLMAVMAIGVPVVWAHDLVAPSAAAGFLMQPLGIALPSLLLTALICRNVWNERIAPDIGLSWIFPALLLLCAGWVLPVFPDRPEMFHSAMMFGVVFALFGSYYRWQADIASIAAPQWLGRVHLVAMGFAILAMMPMFPLLRTIGECGMLISLFCVCALGARLVVPRRMTAFGSVVQ